MQNKIKCFECNKYYKKINISHLLNNCSGLTLEEYRLKYPNVELICEETSKLMSIAASGKIMGNDTKIKLSIAKKGKRIGKDNPFYNQHHGEEALQKMRCLRPSMQGENHPHYGGLSEQHRENLSKGIKQSYKNGRISPMKNKNHSARTKELISLKAVERIIYSPEKLQTLGALVFPKKSERNLLSIFV